MIDKELQKLYSPSLWNKRLPPDQVIVEHGEFMSKRSDLARKSLNSYRFNFSQENKEESIDFFFKNNIFVQRDNKQEISFNGRKIFIYLHGGYWQWGSIEMSCFMAENFCSNDIIVVAIGYDIAPKGFSPVQSIIHLNSILNPKTLKVKVGTIVEQVERAVAKVLEFAETSEVYICGHSAGGHLSAMMLYTDFETKYKVKNKNIKGVIPVSGVFDLCPLIKTDVNDNLKMSLDESILLSPVYKKTCAFDGDGKDRVKILLAYGEHDSPAFKQQSEEYFKILREDLKFPNVTCTQIDNSDHFSIIENISLNEFELTKEIFKFIGI